MASTRKGGDVVTLFDTFDRSRILWPKRTSTWDTWSLCPRKELRPMLSPSRSTFAWVSSGSATASVFGCVFDRSWTEKYLLALRSLKKLEQLLGTTHGTVHANKLRLFSAGTCLNITLVVSYLIVFVKSELTSRICPKLRAKCSSSRTKRSIIWAPRPILIRPMTTTWLLTRRISPSVLPVRDRNF